MKGLPETDNVDVSKDPKLPLVVVLGPDQKPKLEGVPPN